MSIDVEVRDVKHVVVDDIVRSGTSVWRSIHVFGKDGKKATFTLYSDRDNESIPLVIGADDE
jgi:orotate phosphoribosyltransferase-like protein